MLKEFKSFVMKGNILDLAVAVIIGGAFGKIVSSFVNDILMPPIGMALGGVNFTDLVVTLKEAVMDAAGEVTAPAVTMNVGIFVQAIIDFLIVAFVIFMVVKAYNNTQKKEEEAPAAPSNEEVLLAEIRDLLKK
ncbi:MAG: large-conductance mechanosensitive channel protein MscL [Bacteroidia bacterium]|nr:large-conductance mechanosensitive channel protein MscL [Bacteroidia bacterium]